MTPEAALEAIAAQLRAEQSVISGHLVEPDAEPALGMLAAAGPRAADAPGEYAFVVEAVREGYLLHYGQPRLLVGADGDLALLAGDHLYARGLERLAGLADLAAVRELADLISLCAQLHAAGPPAAEASAALWLASAAAIGAGGAEEHERAKRMLGDGDPDAAPALWDAAAKIAARGGVPSALERAAEAIGFRP